MKTRSLFMLLVCFLFGLSAAVAQHEPLLAAIVTSESALNLYRVNGPQLQFLKALPIPIATKGETSNQICLDPAGSTLFVSAPPDNSVMAIDLNQQKVAGTFLDPAMKVPDGCVISPDGKKLYVADRAVDAVFVFATGTHKLLKKIDVAAEPRRAIFLPNGKLVVSSGEGSSLNLIDPASDTVIRTVKGGVDPRAMGVTPDGKRLAVTNTSAEVLAYFDPETLEPIAYFGVGESPQALMVTADGSAIYVLCVPAKLISVVSFAGKRAHPGRVSSKIPIPQGQPVAMAGPPDAQYLFVSLKDGTLVAVDTANKTVTPIAGAKAGGALAYLP